jgi:flagellar biosynthesis protein FlhF
MNTQNVKRFTARTSREALQMVRGAFGEEAVVLSTRPSANGGVEVLAMGPEGIGQIEQAASTAPIVRAPEVAKPAQNSAAEVGHDVTQLAMSTLSFQDYVRERMLKRRQAQRDLAAMPQPKPAAAQAALPSTPELADVAPPAVHIAPAAIANTSPAIAIAAPVVTAAPPLLREELRTIATPVLATDPEAERRGEAMMSELRSMKGLIEERFGALAFMEKLQLSPRRALLTQRLLDAGFSPMLIRKLAEGLANDCDDENAWAAAVLERNLTAAESEPALEDAGGVYALIGATGVGKTTSTAKIAAAFATQHGSGSLGLVTLDAYRVGAQEQLRTYGRILGVPVHTAHDRASLEDLLDLLSAKKMVLIDTAGVGQRDARTRELLEMVSHRSIQKLLVVNAASQGETIEDVMVSYRAAACRGVVLSKIDEAVKIGAALDAVIRHKMRIVGVANGQRVPEDWHRLSASALVQRALRAAASPSWKLDASEVSLVFAGIHTAMRSQSLHA